MLNWPPERGPNPNKYPWVGQEPKIEELWNSLKKEWDLRQVALTHRVDGHVETLSTLTIHQVMHLNLSYVGESQLRRERHVFRTHLEKAGDSLSFVVDYPMSRVAVVTVFPARVENRKRSVTSVESILWGLAQAYKAIYADWEKWGVWGHGIEDLVFESIEVDVETGRGVVYVGS